MQEKPNVLHLKEDEIDLRELFSTILRYKKSIIFFTFLITFLVAIKVYFMPKYYKTTVMLEVKADGEKGAGFSMGGAASLLLGGAGGSANLEKDIALLKTYRTNKKVLEATKSYTIRYFITDENYKELEVESNLSIEVVQSNVFDIKDYGLTLLLVPKSKTEFALYSPGRFHNTLLGTFHYSENVTTEKFSLMVEKKRDVKQEYTLQLLGSKRYIFENIIQKNLSIEASKEAPFLTISYVDTIPSRAEAYVKNLISIYTKLSLDDIKNDASVVMDSYDRQLKKVEERVATTASELTSYKKTKGIIAPSLQASALVEELGKVEIELSQNAYKEDLAHSLITFVKKHKNIDAIAPSLSELHDAPTVTLIALIQDHQLKLSTLKLKYKSEHPLVVNTKRTIGSLKSKVLANLKNLERTIKDKKISLEKMLQTYKSKLNSAPKEAQELVSYTRDYQVNEKMYTYLMQERSAAEIKRDKALSRFKVIEDIYTPQKAVKPKKALIVIVTFISAFIFMIFLAFFREFLKNGKEEKNE